MNNKKRDRIPCSSDKLTLKGKKRRNFQSIEKQIPFVKARQCMVNGRAKEALNISFFGSQHFFHKEEKISVVITKL